MFFRSNAANLVLAFTAAIAAHNAYAVPLFGSSSAFSPSLVPSYNEVVAFGLYLFAFVTGGTIIALEVLAMAVAFFGGIIRGFREGTDYGSR